MSGRKVLVPVMLMLATVGCSDASEPAAQANGASPRPPVAVAQASSQVLPQPAPQRRPAPKVTVRAQPAPRNPLDLPPSDDDGSVEPFPREVTTFMVDRDGCDHFRGEQPHDAERRAYIAENVAELCTGTDARLAMLRRRYAADPAVTAALRSYEDRIEAPATY
ncbi:hypothetical protein [Sphingobium sp.]|uniref:hypothetical protein n=1 Tax=Sphingobium sp. TaxID=1912891 RepID=UPI0025E22D07|nr:hypothetical protein [Sphingobium sp.]